MSTLAKISSIVALVVTAVAVPAAAGSSSASSDSKMTTPGAHVVINAAPHKSDNWPI